MFTIEGVHIIVLASRAWASVGNPNTQKTPFKIPKLSIVNFKHKNQFFHLNVIPITLYIKNIISHFKR